MQIGINHFFFNVLDGLEGFMDTDGPKTFFLRQ